MCPEGRGHGNPGPLLCLPASCPLQEHSFGLTLPGEFLLQQTMGGLLSFLTFSGMFSHECAAVSSAGPKRGNLASSPQHVGRTGGAQLIYRAGFWDYRLQCEPFFADIHHFFLSV